MEGIVKVPNGICPSCWNPLIIVESESHFYLMNNEKKTAEIDNYYKCEAVCKYCGFREEMVRDGNGYKRYNPIDKYLYKYRAKKRLEELQEEPKKLPYKEERI